MLGLGLEPPALGVQHPQNAVQLASLSVKRTSLLAQLTVPSVFTGRC